MSSEGDLEFYAEDEVQLYCGKIYLVEKDLETLRKIQNAANLLVMNSFLFYARKNSTTDLSNTTCNINQKN